MSTAPRTQGRLGDGEGSASRHRGEAGFSLIELVVAMSIFGILMVLVSSVMLSGSNSIKEIWTRSNAQSDAQNAAEWISRQLRFADVPESAAWPITAASPTAITFYSYSGTGPKHDVPYLVQVYVTTTTGDETQAPCLVTTAPTSGAKWKNLCTSVTTPMRTIGGWNWYPTPNTLPPPVTRQLLRVPAASGSPLRVSVYANRPATVPLPTPSPVTPGTLGPLVLTTGVDVPEYVVVQIGDPTDPSNLVTQQVRLVNLQ